MTYSSSKRSSSSGTALLSLDACCPYGIHVNIRLGADKLCLLVLIGVRADGTKELITLADGYRESTESWAIHRLTCG